jgi:hypothetical protein
MSNRTLVELNHDFCPKDNDTDLLMWASRMSVYMKSGDKRMLPEGVTFKHIRHHSEPDPLTPEATPEAIDAIVLEFCRLARLSISGKWAKLFRVFLQAHLTTRAAPSAGGEREVKP